MSPVRPAGAALAALTLFFTLLAGCGGSRAPLVGDDGTPIVAQWSADTLTLTEFRDAFHAAESGMGDSTMTPLERERDFLDRYVDFRLKVLAAREAGYASDSTYRVEVQQYRDQLAGPYFMDREVLDDIVRDIYTKQAEQVQVSHLLLRLDPYAADTAAVYARATQIRDSIRAGQLTFADAATRYSQDPSATREGGQGYRGALGWITGGQTVYPFEQALYDTPVGQIGGPLRTQFGVHVIEVTGRRPAPGEIRAAHILIRPEGPTPADTAAALAQVESLRARVQAGEDFGTLARQYSQDPGSGPQGGDLGFFGGGRMVPSFEAAAFALQSPNDISMPVRTQFGVHLIQLTEKRARPTFDDQYEELKQLAMRLPRTALRRRALGREFMTQNGGAYDEAVVRSALDAMLTTVASDSLTTVLLQNGFPAPYGTTTFATVGDSTYTLNRLRAPFSRVRVGGDPRPALLDAAEAWVEEQAVAQAVNGLEQRDPEFARLFRSYTDGVLYFRIAEDSVWTRAKDDEAGLRAYYEAHQAQYRWPDRRRVLAFRSPGDSVLTAVTAALDAGTAPAAVLAQFSAPRFGLRLDTVFVNDSTRTALDATLSLAPGQHTGVLAERSRLAVYIYDGIEPARPKRFDEARAEVVSAYQEIVESDWEARLRARYQARTYPERIPPVMGADAASLPSSPR